MCFGGSCDAMDEERSFREFRPPSLSHGSLKGNWLSAIFDFAISGAAHCAGTRRQPVGPRPRHAVIPVLASAPGRYGSTEGLEKEGRPLRPRSGMPNGRRGEHFSVPRTEGTGIPRLVERHSGQASCRGNSFLGAEAAETQSRDATPVSGSSWERTCWLIKIDPRWTLWHRRSARCRKCIGARIHLGQRRGSGGDRDAPFAGQDSRGNRWPAWHLAGRGPQTILSRHR